MASGSATGNPRNKTALKPGHSLMDWIRLGNSGKDLTGVKGVFTDVSKAELAQHNSADDAWLSIRGVVYNVTHYMDFHPGGCEELMRGVGTDATNLFNQVHGWVNYESILKKCVIGRLGATCDDADLFSIPSTPNKSFSSLKISNGEKNENVNINWSQQLDSVTLVFYTNLQNPQVQIILLKPDLLQYKINEDIKVLNLEKKVVWPIYVLTGENGKVQLKLTKKKPILWKTCGKIINNSIEVVERDFWPGKIIESTKLTQDSFLIKLKYDDHVYNYIHPSYHIVVKKSINDVEARPYTPVPALPLTSANITSEYRKSDEQVYLLVKVYKDGFMSPWITSQTNATINISNPIGAFKTNLLKKLNLITFFAGGTGITPIIGIIILLLKTSNDKKLKLLYFNKSQKDIIWKKELEELANSYDNRLDIVHILSQPDNEWNGKIGYNNLNLMKSELPHHSGPKPWTDFVCICGRPSFADEVERLLKEELGYSQENYFNFNKYYQ